VSAGVWGGQGDPADSFLSHRVPATQSGGGNAPMRPPVFQLASVYKHYITHEPRLLTDSDGNLVVSLNG